MLLLFVQAGGTASHTLESCVLQKMLVLSAIWLHSQCGLWRSQLPAEVVSAAPPGAYCTLFWPPPGLLQNLGAVDTRCSFSALVRNWWRTLIWTGRIKSSSKIALCPRQKAGLEGKAQPTNGAAQDPAGAFFNAGLCCHSLLWRPQLWSASAASTPLSAFVWFCASIVTTHLQVYICNPLHFHVGSLIPVMSTC
jgi:hypothetical protein